ncbi:MAG: DUF4376 domain-containing protein [Rubrivivax sp.]|jgi:hypothetical protein
MSQYVIFDPATGRVAGFTDALEPPSFQGLSVAVNPNRVNEFPEPPGQGMELRWQGGALHWHDPRTLAQAKAEKWAAIKAEREARIADPKPTPHGPFDGSPADQDNLNKVIALLRVAISRGLPDSANYTLADNTRATFTLEQLEDAALAVGAATQALYDTSSTLRAQVDAATTVEQVAAIAWP